MYNIKNRIWSFINPSWHLLKQKQYQDDIFNEDELRKHDWYISIPSVLESGLFLSIFDSFKDTLVHNPWPLPPAGFSVTAERERCPTRARWPESPHTTQTLCMTQRRPSSPTRCNITEGTGLSYTLTLAYKHITLHTDTHTHTNVHTHAVTYTHPLAAIRTQRDSVIAALSDGLEVKEAAEEAASCPLQWDTLQRASLR